MLSHQILDPPGALTFESESTSGDTGSSSSLTSESESDYSSDSEDEITTEYLHQLLQKARENARELEDADNTDSHSQDVLTLEDDEQLYAHSKRSLLQLLSFFKSSSPA